MQKIRVKTVSVPFGLEDTIANRVNEELSSLEITKENLLNLDIKPVPMQQFTDPVTGVVTVRNGMTATIIYLTEKW